MSETLCHLEILSKQKMQWAPMDHHVWLDHEVLIDDVWCKVIIQKKTKSSLKIPTAKDEDQHQVELGPVISNTAQFATVHLGYVHSSWIYYNK